MPKNNFQAHFNANSYRFFAKRSNVQHKKKKKKNTTNLSIESKNINGLNILKWIVANALWINKWVDLEIFLLQFHFDAAETRFMMYLERLLRWQENYAGPRSLQITHTHTHHWHKQPLVSMCVCVCLSHLPSYLSKPMRIRDK